MDMETFKSLTAVIDFLYADEQKDWEAEGKPEGHIFNDIKRVKGWTQEVGKDYV